ncbi:hypothetical protein C8R45DRAFT_825734, partial [Mycena sanguinolenta]
SKHAQIAREEKDTLRARAVVFYRHELEKDLLPGEKRISLRTVCTKFEGAYRIDTGNSIGLDHNTLLQLVKGGKSKSLSDHKRLKEAVDEICRARLGN